MALSVRKRDPKPQIVGSNPSVGYLFFYIIPESIQKIDLFSK